MEDRKNIITSRQLMAIIISSQLGLGCLFLPPILAEKVGHDAWISAFIMGCIQIILVVIIMKLLKRYQDKSILEMNKLVYGKVIGTLINYIIIACLVFKSGIFIRIFTEAVKIMLLPNTPQIVVSLLLLSPTLYMTTKGLKLIGRFSYLLFVSYILLILSFLLIKKDARTTFLMPIGSSGMACILKSMSCTVYSYLGIELLPLIYQNVKDKKKSFKEAILSSVFVTIFFTLTVAFSTALLGEVKLSMMVFPVLSIGGTIYFPVLDKLDIVYIMLWYPTMGAFVRIYFFSACYSISRIYKVNNKKVLITFVFLFSLLISMIPINFEDIYRYNYYIGIVGFFIIILIILTYIMALARKVAVNSN